MSFSRSRLPRRIAQLTIGLFLYGFGIALLIQASLGSAPWDVLSQGVTNHVHLSFGVVTIIVSGIVLLLWIPLRQRPGIGTLANAVAIGPSADISFLMLGEPTQLWLRVVFMACGVVVIGFATGLYIGARFGPGPRDGLMTGLHGVTGWPIWVVRTGIEVIVVIVGWALGGVVGFGTIAFALLIGPICQVFLRVFWVVLPRDSQTL